MSVPASQPDFFICDILDVALKGDTASMEHPVFSVAARPDMETRRYENGPVTIKVTPSGRGMATILDRDVLIYCISQLVAAQNREEPISRQVRFHTYDFLKATGRTTGGTAYGWFEAALERLLGTTITTTIKTGGESSTDGFTMIDRFRVVRKDNPVGGRMLSVEVTLSEWMYRAIQSNEVLTLSPEYFRLKSPLARRVYEIARKHCGNQNSWKIGVQKLMGKCGTNMTAKAFRQKLRALAAKDALPDYAMIVETDMVTFTNGSPRVPVEVLSEVVIPPLDSDTYETAKAVLGGLDVYQVEQEWRRWVMTNKQETPKNATAAFIGFCAKYAAQHS